MLQARLLNVEMMRNPGGYGVEYQVGTFDLEIDRRDARWREYLTPPLQSGSLKVPNQGARLKY